MKFILNSCGINFVAEAPEDITLKQLLKQCDKIKLHWCACGIRSLNKYKQNLNIEIKIDYNNIQKIDDDAPCDIIDILKF